MNVDPDITYFGRVAHRSDDRAFGIRQDDRFYHMYVIGKTGTGKTHLLETMISQDLARGRGFAVFDPHGDLARNVAARRAERGSSDFVYFDATDPELEWGFNPFAGVPPEKRSHAAAGIVEVFRKLWPDDWGPRLEHLLRNVAFALLEVDGATLADIPALLSDRSFRSSVVADLTNEQVRHFWTEEYARYSPAFRAVVTAPLENKVGALLTDPMLRRIFTGTQGLDVRSVMDAGGALVVNLDKGIIGEGPSSILGAFLVSHIGVCGLARSEHLPNQRRDFVLYLDEFQNFATVALVTMLAELRKYKVGVVLAHQHLAQLPPAVRAAIFGNVGTTISFAVGAADASAIANEFVPTFGVADLLHLERFHFYVRLAIGGHAGAPFSASSLDASFYA